jgi:hypothetical protein
MEGANKVNKDEIMPKDANNVITKAGPIIGINTNISFFTS